MAEIKIEKKKPIWPWILIILIILAAVYFFWVYNDKDIDSTDDGIERDTISQVEDPYRNEVMETTTYIYTGTYGNVRDERAMADYFIFVDSLKTDSTARSFYRNGFFKLITATKRQAEIDSVDVNSNISSAMENTEKLTNAPSSTEKAEGAKKAATEISKALKTIQNEDYDNLANEAKEVEESASKIEGAQTLEKQSANIDTFFDKSARLLQKMNESNENENNQ